MATEARLVQKLNAEFPIEVTELGMVNEVSPTRLLHRLAGIVLTLSPKINDVILAL